VADDVRKPSCLLSEAFVACRRAFVSTGLFSFAINLLLLTVSLYMLQVYDRVLSTRSFETLLYLTLIAVVALLVLGLLDVVRSRILVEVGTWLEERLAPAAFAGTLANSLRGRAYRSEALRDLREIRSFLGGSGILALFDAPAAPLFIFAIFVLHPVLGIFAVAATVLLFTLAVLNDLVTRAPIKAASEAGVRAMRQVEAYNRNAEVIDALGMLGRLIERWRQRNYEALSLQSQASHRAGLILGLSKFSRLAVQVLMLGAGALLVIQQELTGGAMIAGSIILARALAPVEQAIGLWKQMISAQAAHRRLKACFAEPPLRPASMPLPAPSVPSLK
jgi:ABC-type protease/lipase transport system fused ATPase/permease subunit